MSGILIVVEHNQGEVNDCTFQMIWKAHELCRDLSFKLTAVVLGGHEEPFIASIGERVDRLILYEDDSIKNFNSEYYSEIIKNVIDEEQPFITMIGHTPRGLDLAPALSIKTDFPIASDCVDIKIDNGEPKVIRQIYGGKLLSKVKFKKSKGYIITIRPGAFPAEKQDAYQCEVIRKDIPLGIPEPRKRFIEFKETISGDVDITQADLLISIGRGIGEEENIELFSQLADKMGGALSCSRPVVDKGWLPKYHQVGTSGKTVKPKVYLAFGISGSFQHIAGISGAGAVIAVNRDKKAPIFRTAKYGIVSDLFKVADALNKKLG